jgi:competence protein ComFC
VLKKLFTLLSCIINFLLDVFFPPFCCCCEKLGSYICHDCYQFVEFYSQPIQLKLDPLYLDQVIAATYYYPPIKQLIRFLKYQSVIGIGAYCGQLLYYTTNFPDADVITAVPLHPKRQDERGFNQAEEIAKELSKLTHIPYQQLLKRNHYTNAQAKVSHRSQRLKNLQNVFEVLPAEPVPARVLLIDDVVTTGSTLNECTKVLKEHGAKQVFALTVSHGS